jgi:AraC-like DNA-binding protein
MGELAAELGFSRKHVVSLFRDHVGLPPKLYAEVVRFDRLTRRLKTGPDASWARLALELGFADQAHLAREVRRFAGVTPREIRLLVTGALGEPPA